jgi:hypothetical protein
MRKLCFGGLAVLVLSALVQAGGDPWNRPFGEWTDKDVATVRQNSPWVRTLLAKGTRPYGHVQAGLLPFIGVVATDFATPDMPNEKSDDAESPAAYLVWWWSSRTIRSTFLRDAVLNGKTTQPDAQKKLPQPLNEHEIVIFGTNMQILQQQGEKSFEEDAFLEIKRTKAKVSPSHVAFVRRADGTVRAAVLYFPRRDASGAPTIAPDDKEIDFYFQIGGRKLRTYFEPKKMIDSQGEDL